MPGMWRKIHIPEGLGVFKKQLTERKALFVTGYVDCRRIRNKDTFYLYLSSFVSATNHACRNVHKLLKL